MVRAEYIGFYYLPREYALQLKSDVLGGKFSHRVEKAVIDRAVRQYRHRPSNAIPQRVSIDLKHSVDTGDARLVVAGLGKTDHGDDKLAVSSHRRDRRSTSPAILSVGRTTLKSGQGGQSLSASTSFSTNAAAQMSEATNPQFQFCCVRGENVLLATGISTLFSFVELEDTVACKETVESKLGAAVRPNIARIPLVIGHVFNCKSKKEAELMVRAAKELCLNSMTRTLPRRSKDHSQSSDRKSISSRKSAASEFSQASGMRGGLVAPSPVSTGSGYSSGSSRRSPTESEKLERMELQDLVNSYTSASLDLDSATDDGGDTEDETSRLRQRVGTGNDQERSEDDDDDDDGDCSTPDAGSANGSPFVKRKSLTLSGSPIGPRSQELYSTPMEFPECLPSFESDFESSRGTLRRTGAVRVSKGQPGQHNAVTRKESAKAAVKKVLYSQIESTTVASSWPGHNPAKDSSPGQFLTKSQGAAVEFKRPGSEVLPYARRNSYQADPDDGYIIGTPAYILSMLRSDYGDDSFQEEAM